MVLIRHRSTYVLASLLSLSLAGCRAQNVQKADPAPIPVAAPAACTSQRLSPEALFSGAKAGVVVVETDDSQGSGFVVMHQDGRTLVLTNAHVVGANRSVTLRWADGREDQAAVVANGGAASPQSDLALLLVEGLRGTPLQIKPALPPVGADVVALGAPKGLEFSLTRGVVSSVRERGELIQLDAPINPGNSGGPVLDQTGCVIGIATFKLSESEGLNFAVGAEVIRGFLARPTPVAEAPAPDIPLDPGQNRSQEPATDDQPANCWFQLQAGSSDLTGLHCQVTGRTNSNGHVVHDIIEPNGGHRRSVVLWDNNAAEVFLDGEPYSGEWSTDSDGDVRVTVNGGVFIYTRP